MQIIRQFIKRIKRRIQICPENFSSIEASKVLHSTGYKLLKSAGAEKLDGWRTASAAERQHQAFIPLTLDARAGRPRHDLKVASLALEATGLIDPLVIEVGCGSGYYYEILSILLKRPLRYIGVDYSESMIALATRTYPTIFFLNGDACRLPLRTACCDVLLSGNSLMHIIAYKQAIAESARVSRKWLIFHTVPVMAKRSTTLLRKLAYGEPVYEVIFNQSELEAFFCTQKLDIEAKWDSISYDVSAVVGEKTWTLTYLCQKR